MLTALKYVFVFIVAYFVGTSNMTYFISRFKNIEVRDKGSKNLGASNATIILGWRAGIAAGLHDIGKSAICVILASSIFTNLQYIGAVAGVASVFGHIFPFYLKFRGGKGFASYIGMTLALNWKFALFVLVIIVLVTLLTDYLFAGTLTTVLSVPIALGFITNSLILTLILLIASGVIIYKHRENFVRIHKGTEIGLMSTLKGENKHKR